MRLWSTAERSQVWSYTGVLLFPVNGYKNGNKYLSWAFAEAAEIGRRFDDKVRAFYNRKAVRTNRMIAHSTLAHKIARAAFYIM
jgi:hypothetical protein